jgi:hypothetical protein
MEKSCRKRSKNNIKKKEEIFKKSLEKLNREKGNTQYNRYIRLLRWQYRYGRGPCNCEKWYKKSWYDTQEFYNT